MTARSRNAVLAQAAIARSGKRVPAVATALLPGPIDLGSVRPHDSVVGRLVGQLV